ncbi:MAG TPA: prolyl oligopeptidase family serine peptidase [Actinomycetota bacterium]
MPQEATWRRRYRATLASLPVWAEDQADRLLQVSNEEGRFELYSWDLRTGDRRRMTDRPEGTRTGAIEPGGRQVWWFDDEGGSEHGVWRAQPFEGGPAVAAAPGLAPAYPSGLALGHGLAVVGTTGDDGSDVHLVRPGATPARVYHSVEYAAVGGLSRDGGLLAIEHSEHGDSRHPALRVLDVSGEAVADLWDGPGLGLSAEDWSPRRGDQRLIVTNERQGVRRPAVWSPREGALLEPPVDLPGEVSATWYPDAAALLLRHQHAGRSQLYRYELGSGTLQEVTVPPGSVGAAAVRPDGRIWIEHSSGARPPAFLEADRVLFTPPGAAAPAGVPYRDLQVGDVHGFWVAPPGPPPHPTIFWVHGGPAAHDRDAFSPRVQAWVDHGYAVVLVNYRGSTGYGREWRDALQDNPGLTELEDLAAVRAHLVREGLADPSRLILGGASWGGYLTLLGLGRQPDAWSLGLAAVPVADYVAAFEDEMEPLQAFDRALFGGTPAEIPDRYLERSPITYVDRVRAPLLIIAGRNDPRCPIRQIENYLGRLRSLGHPHEFYEFQAGHSSLVIDEQIRQMEAQIAFAHRHLATPSPL